MFSSELVGAALVAIYQSGSFLLIGVRKAPNADGQKPKDCPAQMQTASFEAVFLIRNQPATSALLAASGALVPLS